MTALRTGNQGTPGYRAPEVLQEYAHANETDTLGVYSLAVDIWSVGVVAFELLTGKKPFENESEILTFYRQEDSKLPRKTLGILKRARVNNDAIAFVSKLLDRVAYRRPTASAALIEVFRFYNYHFCFIFFSLKSDHTLDIMTDTIAN